MEKQLRVIKWPIIKYSKDTQIQQLYEYRLALDRKGHIGRGNRTSPCLTLDRLERSQELDRITRNAQFGRQGLGFRYTYRKVEPRAEIIALLKREAEEKRLIVLHQYQLQTPWLSWGLDSMMRSDLTWNSLLYEYSDRLLKFVVNMQTNTLPTPDNLRRWALRRNVQCGLCGQNEVTLSHILGGCPWVRQAENQLEREDRYTWRHNNILYTLANVIKDRIDTINRLPESKVRDPLITFVRAGEVAKKSSLSKPRNVLHQARDWVLNFDLPEFRRPFSKYTFPQDVCATPLKVDGHVISRQQRICIIIELTVPMEHNISHWHQSKLTKYESELRAEAERNKWKLHCLILEVGARGWIPPSVTSSLNFLGIPAVGKICKSLSLVAVKSSYIVWLNRFNRDFHPFRLSAQHLRTSPSVTPAHHVTCAVEDLKQQYTDASPSHQDQEARDKSANEEPSAPELEGLTSLVEVLKGCGDDIAKMIHSLSAL